MQRLGRVARLGTQQARVEVVWFPPPPVLDLPERLSRKERIAQEVLRTKRLTGVQTSTDATRKLAGTLLRRAQPAGRAHDSRLLTALDAVLERLRLGLVVGAERELTELLAMSPTARAVEEWLSRWMRSYSP